MTEQEHVAEAGNLALETEQKIRALRKDMVEKAQSGEAIEAHGGLPYSDDEIDLAAITYAAFELAQINHEIVEIVRGLNARMSVLHNAVVDAMTPEQRSEQEASINAMRGLIDATGMPGVEVQHQPHASHASHAGVGAGRPPIHDEASLHTGQYL